MIDKRVRSLAEAVAGIPDGGSTAVVPRRAAFHNVGDDLHVSMRVRGKALTRRDEVGRLFDLSRDVLLITDSETANSSLAGFIARRFDLHLSRPSGEYGCESSS